MNIEKIYVRSRIGSLHVWIRVNGRWLYRRFYLHNRQVVKALARLVRKYYREPKKIALHYANYVRGIKMNNFDRGLLKKAVKEIILFLREGKGGEEARSIPGNSKDTLLVVVPSSYIYYMTMYRLINENKCDYMYGGKYIIYCMTKNKLLYIDYEVFIVLSTTGYKIKADSSMRERVMDLLGYMIRTCYEDFDRERCDKFKKSLVKVMLFWR